MNKRSYSRELRRGTRTLLPPGLNGAFILSAIEHPVVLPTSCEVSSLPLAERFNLRALGIVQNKAIRKQRESQISQTGGIPTAPKSGYLLRLQAQSHFDLRQGPATGNAAMILLQR